MSIFLIDPLSEGKVGKEHCLHPNRVASVHKNELEDKKGISNHSVVYITRVCLRRGVTVRLVSNGMYIRSKMLTQGKCQTCLQRSKMLTLYNEFNQSMITNLWLMSIFLS